MTAHLFCRKCGGARDVTIRRWYCRPCFKETQRLYQERWRNAGIIRKLNRFIRWKVKQIFGRSDHE